LALLIERDGDRDSITMRSTKSRDALVKPFSAQWTYENEGSELTRGRFFGLRRPVSEEGLDAAAQAREFIIEHIESGMNQTAVVRLVKDQIGIGRPATRDALKELVSEKKLYTRVGNHGAILYDRAV
jgi:hypothetical protein